MSTTKPEFKYDYKKYVNPGVTVEQLDALVAPILKDVKGVGTLTMVFMALRLAVVVGYLWARNRLIDNQMLLDKQQYEQDQRNSARDEIDQAEDIGEPLPVSGA